MIPTPPTPRLALRCRPATYLDCPPPTERFVGAQPDAAEAQLRLDQWIDTPAHRLAMLVDAQPPRRKPAVARLLAVAAAVPLMALPLRARAAPPSDTSPVVEVPPSPAAASDEAPAAVDPTEPTRSSSASEPTVPAAASEPTAAEPPPTPTHPADPLALTGRVLWDGLLNRPIILELSDDTVLAGTLINQTRHSLILGVDGYPEPFEVAKQEVRGVSEQRRQLEPKPTIDSAPPRGTGLLVGGILLTVAGAAGMVGYGIAGGSPSYLFYFGIPAAAAVGAGIPMIVVGAKRRQDYKRKLSVAPPSVYAGRHGGGATLRLRF